MSLMNQVQALEEKEAIQAEKYEDLASQMNEAKAHISHYEEKVLPDLDDSQEQNELRKVQNELYRLQEAFSKGVDEYQAMAEDQKIAASQVEELRDQVFEAEEQNALLSKKKKELDLKIVEREDEMIRVNLKVEQLHTKANDHLK